VARKEGTQQKSGRLESCFILDTVDLLRLLIAACSDGCVYGKGRGQALRDGGECFGLKYAAQDLPKPLVLQHR
jgi:hypothetical protein